MTSSIHDSVEATRDTVIMAYNSIVVLRDYVTDAIHDIESSFAKDGRGQEVTLEKVRLLRQWLDGLRDDCPVAIALSDKELDSFPDRYASSEPHRDNPAFEELEDEKLQAFLKEVRDSAVDEHGTMIALHQHVAGYIQTAIEMTVAINGYPKNRARAKMWLSRMRLATGSRKSLACVKDAIARLEAPLDKNVRLSRLKQTKCESPGVLQ